MKEKNCLFCGGIFRSPPSEHSRRVYCSRKCMANGLHHSKADARFFERIHTIPESGCWLIDGDPVGDGYVKFLNKRAHRWAFERFVSPIPAGMVVRHRCDVPCCVNPNHLHLGTQAENIRDKVIKNRQAKGSAMGAAKLDEASVAMIRRVLSERYMPGMYTSMAKEFGVDRAVIARIHKGKAWKHVT